MHDKILRFLSAHRYTSQFVIDALRDTAAIDDLLAARKLLIAVSDDEISSMTYVSASPRVHIVGRFCPEHFETFGYVGDASRFTGVNGSSNAINSFLEWSQGQGLPTATHIFNEIVFSLALPTSLRTQFSAELLILSDFADWHRLYVDYLREMKINSSATQTQRRERFEREVSQKMHWGLRSGGELISIGAFNAMTEDSAQIGGVFTPNAHRRKGHSENVMRALIRDAYKIHRLKELILFTGQDDHGPQALYRKLEFVPVGDYSVAEF